jgi:hypothetical protein
MKSHATLYSPSANASSRNSLVINALQPIENRVSAICRRRKNYQWLQSLVILMLYLPFSISAQTTADFENLSFGALPYLNNATASGGVFTNGNIALVNNYTPSFMSWDGWAISKDTDTTTPGFTNEYSCIAGAGAGGSQVYAVSYVYEPAIVRLTGAAAGKAVQGMYVNNSTYAYLSMKNGDAFAKRFGGATGNDPDYFLLTIKAWLNGAEKPDSVLFYLADYRFANNAQDYIVKNWTFVNLSSLGDADSLAFTLSSTDNGAFGMNTPAYFCMDRFTTLDGATDLEKPESDAQLVLYPNPAQSQLSLSNWKGDASAYQVFDAIGRLVMAGQLQQNRLDISGLDAGCYVLKVDGLVGRFVKG